MAQQPLILVLLSHLLRVVGVVSDVACAVAWLPVRLMLSSALALLSPPPATLRACLALTPPRAVVAFAVPSALLFASRRVVPLVWALSSSRSPLLATLNTAVACALLLGALVRGRGRDPHPPEASLLVSLTVRVALDVVVCACALVVGVLVVRAPTLARLAASDRTDFRPECFVEVARSVVDWALLAPFLLVLATQWRWDEMRTNQGRSAKFADQRWCVVDSAFEVVLDCLAFALAVPVLLLGYRARRLVSAVRRADTPTQRRAACLKAAARQLLDIPFMCMAVAIVALGVRARALWRLARARLPARVVGVRVWRLLVASVLDYAAFVAVVLVVVPTGYRVPTVWRIVRRELRPPPTPEPVRPQPATAVADAIVPPSFAHVHRLLFSQVEKTLVEIPCWVVALPALVTGYRAPNLVRRVRAVPLDDRATEAALEGIEWFCDLPFIAGGLLGAALFLWRVPNSVHVWVRETTTATERRRLVVVHWARGVVDVPCLCAAMLVLVTGYRVPCALAEAKAIWSAKTDAAQREALVGLLHTLALTQAANVVVDAPFIAAAAVSLLGVWRAPSFVAQLRRDDTADLRRATTVRNLCLVGWDVVALVSAAACALTVWRAIPMHAAVWRWRRLRAQRNFAPLDDSLALHRALAREGVLLVVELPLVVVCLPLALWHAFDLFDALMTLEVQRGVRNASGSDNNSGNSKKKKGNKGGGDGGDGRGGQGDNTDSLRRVACVTYAALSVADVVALVAAAATLCTGWQTRSLVRDVRAARARLPTASRAPHHELWAAQAAQHQHQSSSPWARVVGLFAVHMAVARNVVLFVLDVPFIALLAAACVTLHRIPAVVRLARELEHASARRKLLAAAPLFARAVLDLPCALVCAVLCLTWRSRAARRIAWDAVRGEGGDFHRAVLLQGRELLADLPFVAAAPLCAWRLPSVVRTACLDPSPAVTAPVRRRAVVCAVVGCALDVVALAAFAAAACVPWRTVPAVKAAVAGVLESVRGEDPLVAAPALATLRSVRVFLPTDTDNHGLCVRLRGRKPPGLAFTKAWLHIEGEVWDALAKKIGGYAVGAARAAFCPVALCPTFLDASACRPGTDELDLTLTLACGYNNSSPRLSHDTLLGHVRGVLAGGADPGMVFRVSFAGGPDGPLAAGNLARFALRVGDVQTQTLFVAAGEDRPDGVVCKALDACTNNNDNGANKANNNDDDNRDPTPAPASPAGPSVVCAFHTAAVRTCATAVADLWLELLALAMCAVPPFARVPFILSALFNVGWRATDDAQHRRRVLKDQCWHTVQNALALLAACVVVAALWRPPQLVFRVWRVVRAGWRGEGFHDRWTGKRDAGFAVDAAACAVVLDEVVCVVLDLAALLQLVFIVGTLVTVPELVARLHAMARYAARRRSERLAAARQRNNDGNNNNNNNGGDAHGQPRPYLTHMPRELVTELVLPHLDARSLSCLAATCRTLREEADQDRYWAQAVERDFGANHVHAPLRSCRRSMKQVYVGLHLQRFGRPSKPRHVVDYERGARFVVEEQFAVAWGNLSHFLLLPVKAAVLLMVPAMLVLRWRYTKLRWRVFDATRHWCDPLPRLNFWNAHDRLLWMGAELLASVVHHVAIVVAVFNLGAWCVLTLGCPLWSRLLGHTTAPARDVLVSLAAPAFTCVQVALALAPVYWWAPTVSAMAWSFAASTASALGFLLHACARLLAAGVWVVFGVSTSAVVAAAQPYAQYLGSAVPLAALAPALSQALLPTTATLAGLAARAHQLPSTLAAAAAPSLVSFLHLASSHAPHVVRVVVEGFLAPFELAFAVEVGVLVALHQLTVDMTLVGLPFRVLLWIGSTRAFIVVAWLATLAWANSITFGEGIRLLFPEFRPFWVLEQLASALRDLVRSVVRAARAVVLRVFRSFRLYAWLLRLPTRACVRLGTVGDVLLVPVSLAWMFWPLHVPYSTGEWGLLLTAVPAAAGLCYWGRDVIRQETARS